MTSPEAFQEPTPEETPREETPAEVVRVLEGREPIGELGVTLERGELGFEQIDIQSGDPIAAGNAVLQLEGELNPWDKKILEIFLDRVTQPT